MSLSIEEVDQEGRAIFFKCPADISKSVEFTNYELSTHDRVNNLYADGHLPSPKFRGYVYNYHNFLTICSCSESGRQKLKQKVDYAAIKATYPCEIDPTVVFMVAVKSRGRRQIRVLRFPSAVIGTKFRYVVDQFQLSPSQELGYFTNESLQGTNNSGSSFSTPMVDDSDESVTSASRYFNRSAAHNPTMQSFYGRNVYEEPKLPRVQPFGFSSVMDSNAFSGRRSTRQRSINFDNFDPTDYEIYQPVSRRSRIERGDYEESRRSSSRRPSRRRYESSGINYNSRAAVHGKGLVYLDPEYEEYRRGPYRYPSPHRSVFDQFSRSGSIPRRPALY